jgi:hypothetical protein
MRIVRGRVDQSVALTDILERGSTHEVTLRAMHAAASCTAASCAAASCAAATAAVCTDAIAAAAECLRPLEEGKGVLTVVRHHGGHCAPPRLP